MKKPAEKAGFYLETDGEGALLGLYIAEASGAYFIRINGFVSPMYLKAHIKELIEKGQDVNFDDVLSDIEKRDKNDRERDIAPCVPAEDAILLDNSEINFEQTVEAALRIIEECVK